MGGYSKQATVDLERPCDGRDCKRRASLAALRTMHATLFIVHCLLPEFAGQGADQALGRAVSTRAMLSMTSGRGQRSLAGKVCFFQTPARHCYFPCFKTTSAAGLGPLVTTNHVQRPTFSQDAFSDGRLSCGKLLRSIVSVASIIHRGR